MALGTPRAEEFFKEKRLQSHRQPHRSAESAPRQGGRAGGGRTREHHQAAAQPIPASPGGMHLAHGALSQDLVAVPKKESCFI